MTRWKVVPDVATYFTTASIVDWYPVFLEEKYFQVMIDALKYCIQHKSLHLHGYVIMPDHAHYLVSTSERSLSEIMRDYHSFTAKAITALLTKDDRRKILHIFNVAAILDERGNSYKVWQDGFHPITITSEKFLRQKLKYIHENPVRRGFVTKAENWKYSSARNYNSHDHSVIEVECI